MITVQGSPAKNGSNFANARTVVLPDGKKLFGGSQAGADTAGGAAGGLGSEGKAGVGGAGKVFGGATGDPGRSGLPKPGPADYALVRVYYATDRNIRDLRSNDQPFGAEYSPTLNYGYGDVAVPRDRDKGSLAARSLWRFSNETIPDIGSCCGR